MRARQDIIVIGASGGGVEALKELVRGLPAELPAAVFIVLHVSAQSPSLLPSILNHAGALKASHPISGERMRHGRIYVAPPDHHLILERGYIRVIRGPKENRHRPAVDPLFRSSARSFGPRVIGVVLTGNLDDGTAGLLAIKGQGGTAIVQDPKEALCSGMPENALANVEADFCLPLAQIAPVLVELVSTTERGEKILPDTQLDTETEAAKMEANEMKDVEKLGQPSAFTCPECHGVLWEIDDQELLRFSCHVGHAFTIESLEAAQSEEVELALWAALRALKEDAAIARRLAEQMRATRNHIMAERFEAKAVTRHREATILRQILVKDEE